MCDSCDFLREDHEQSGDSTCKVVEVHRVKPGQLSQVTLTSKNQSGFIWGKTWMTLQYFPVTAQSTTEGVAFLSDLTMISYYVLKLPIYSSYDLL